MEPNIIFSYNGELRVLHDSAYYCGVTSFAGKCPATFPDLRSLFEHGTFHSLPNNECLVCKITFRGVGAYGLELLIQHIFSNHTKNDFGMAITPEEFQERNSRDINRAIPMYLLTSSSSAATPAPTSSPLAPSVPAPTTSSSLPQTSSLSVFSSSSANPAVMPTPPVNDRPFAVPSRPARQTKQPTRLITSADVTSVSEKQWPPHSYYIYNGKAFPFNDRISSFVCDFLTGARPCGASYNSLSLLTQHGKIHKLEKYSCPECHPDRLMSASTYSRHITTKLILPSNKRNINAPSNPPKRISASSSAAAAPHVPPGIPIPASAYLVPPAASPAALSASSPAPAALIPPTDDRPGSPDGTFDDLSAIPTPRLSASGFEVDYGFDPDSDNNDPSF